MVVEEGAEEEAHEARDVLRQLSIWHLHGVQKGSNEEGRFNIPSSIDIRPMEERGTNAYAQMDRCATAE